MLRMYTIFESVALMGMVGLLITETVLYISMLPFVYIITVVVCAINTARTYRGRSSHNNREIVEVTEIYTSARYSDSCFQNLINIHTVGGVITNVCIVKTRSQRMWMDGLTILYVKYLKVDHAR